MRVVVFGAPSLDQVLLDLTAGEIGQTCFRRFNLDAAAWKDMPTKRSKCHRRVDSAALVASCNSLAGIKPGLHPSFPAKFGGN